MNTKVEDVPAWLKNNGIFDAAVIGDKYFIGRYRVMYGYRVRGGYIGDCACEFDVCCGTSEALMQVVQTKYEKKVRENLEAKRPTADGLMSCSLIKPIHNDPDFMKFLGDL